MTLWNALLLASVACVSLKAVGYLLPARWLEAPRLSRIVDLLTVALLSALVMVKTRAAGPAIVVDARVPAVAVAALLLWLRAPFFAVVVAAGLTAALLRLWGVVA